MTRTLDPEAAYRGHNEAVGGQLPSKGGPNGGVLTTWTCDLTPLGNGSRHRVSHIIDVLGFQEVAVPLNIKVYTDSKNSAISGTLLDRAIFEKLSVSR